MANLDLRFNRWRERSDTSPPRSLWLDDAFEREAPLPIQLIGEKRADVCIVGGGFTGLWTAIRLREQPNPPSVTIVEADLCGAGASGRNSGGTGTWWGKLSALIRLVGKEEALTILHASVDAINDIEAFVADNAIECELRRVKSVWAATAPNQVGAWDFAFKAAEQVQLEPPWRRLPESEMREMFGDKGPYRAGVIDANAMRVQPAFLARGLQAHAIKMGVTVYEKTPVVRILEQGNQVLVQTDSGVVRCDQLVLAANAWMSHLEEFQPHIAVTSSEIVATDPIPKVLAERGLAQRPGGVNSRMMLNYGGRTPDGRIYLGRGGGSIAFANRIGPKFDHSARQLAEVESDFRYLYPELNDVPITRGWSGPIDRSTTGLPWFGSLKASSRVHYGIGYSGHGVGATALGGRILASRVMGAKDNWSGVGDCLQHARRGSFPPEPIRYFGGLAVRAGVARKEMAERDGKKPAPLDKWLATLAPATISEFKPRPD